MFCSCGAPTGQKTLHRELRALHRSAGRDEVTDDQKAAYDGEYAKDLSFKEDCSILFKTVADVVQSRGVHDRGNN